MTNDLITKYTNTYITTSKSLTELIKYIINRFILLFTYIRTPFWDKIKNSPSGTFQSPRDSIKEIYRVLNSWRFINSEPTDVNDILIELKDIQSGDFTTEYFYTDFDIGIQLSIHGDFGRNWSSAFSGRALNP